MGTRATIRVIDGGGSYTIYRHSDGDPETVMAELPAAFAYAWKLPRFEADDFAAAIVAAWKTGGGQIYLTEGHEVHGDTSYQYDVMLEDGVVRVDVVRGHTDEKTVWLKE